MDFETLAVAKSYTNQQILNSGQENSDEPLVLNMLDYGVDLGTILMAFDEQRAIWQGDLTNIDLLKEKVNKQESKEIIVVLESNIVEGLKLILPGSLYGNNDDFLISTNTTVGWVPFFYECTLILLSSGEVAAIREDIFSRIAYLLPGYADTGEDDGKFLRIAYDKPAWVSLDDVSEVGA